MGFIIRAGFKYAEIDLEAPDFIKILISNKSTTLTQVAEDLRRAGGISYTYNGQKFKLSA